MEPTLIVSQFLNGVALGMLLFLLAAGLNLMFGLMGVLNLAHGSYFMVGGFVGLSTLEWSESFILAILAAGISNSAAKVDMRVSPWFCVL